MGRKRRSSGYRRPSGGLLPIIIGIAVVGIMAYCVVVLCPDRLAATEKLSSKIGLTFRRTNAIPQRGTGAAAPAPAPAPASQPSRAQHDFKVAAVVDRTGGKQPSDDAAPNQRSWSTFDEISGGTLPMQTNPMASARDSDLGRRAREIYAATAPTRDARTASTVEQPQVAEL